MRIIQAAGPGEAFIVLLVEGAFSTAGFPWGSHEKSAIMSIMFHPFVKILDVLQQLVLDVHNPLSHLSMKALRIEQGAT